MTHFGALCNPGHSHVMTIAAVGRELQSRGHRFTLFGVQDLAKVAEKHGISFRALDNSRNYLPPVDTFLETLERQFGLSYREMLRYGIGEISLYCQQAPEAMKDAGIECLVADQAVVAASTVAERLNVPFVTMCSAIPIRSDAEVPPSSKYWPYNPAWWSKGRNRLTYSLVSLFSAPFSRKLNGYRRAWGLPAYRRIDDTFSPMAQITQLVPELDFPFANPPKNFHYVGPYRRQESQKIDFPYERLDGRPVIFAVLGMHLGATPGIWQTIAESCMGLDAQLVISLGGQNRRDDLADLPGKPLVMPFVPQVELLKRTALMISHAGINSVMEAFAEGVPQVSLPACGDQPGTSLRIAATGAGEYVPLSQCEPELLRLLVHRVFKEPSYKAKALALQKAIQKTRGILDAGDIIERVSKTPVPWKN